MPVMEVYCTACDHVVREQTPHCPECGAADPWDERPTYQFDSDGLPIVFSHEIYDDNYDLWRSFVGEHFGHGGLNGSDIAGLPEDFPRMKYCVFEVYFVITEDYELEGPFLDRPENREATA